MNTSRFTDSRITALLKQNETGSRAPDLCLDHCISSASLYKRHNKCCGMDASLMMRMKELADENRRQKKPYAEQNVKAEIAKEIIEKKL